MSLGLIVGSIVLVVSAIVAALGYAIDSSVPKDVDISTTKDAAAAARRV